MADIAQDVTSSPSELLGMGRRHLAVRDYHSATESLAKACEMLAQEHGDTADQCAEAYLWYGKALLGLSREESGVFGDRVPGPDNDGDEGDENDDADDDENEGSDKDEAESAEVEEEKGAESKETSAEKAKTVERIEPQSSTSGAQSSSSIDQPGTSNGGGNDESVADLGEEDDIDNLQLAWEMLDLARSILDRRVQDSGEAKALLADVHLALGEVALESETYDKAVVDMKSCLVLQKELYSSDDRRIAETHYQIGLANSLASNFEDAITHFKNAANILETRIKTLESPLTANEDATVKKYSGKDPFYSVEGEIKELKDLLPEIREKIQDMMDYKAETIKRLRETLCPTNGEGSQSNGSAKSDVKAANINHLIKRKRKSTENEDDASAPKKSNT